MRRPHQPRMRRTFDIWQIVYIDLMTNVMIFFVVLWAVQNRPNKSGISDTIGTETVKMVSLPGDVLFPSGRSELTEAGHQVVAKLFSDDSHTVLNFDVGPLTKRMLVIHGHTDNEGLKEKNLELGYQRALTAYREILKYGSDLPDHVVICTHADNSPAQEVPAFGGTLSSAEELAVKQAKAKNRRITIEDKLVSRVKEEPVIGAKTLVTLTLLTAGAVAAVSFGVLSPERLANRGWATLFLVGAFAVVVGTLMFRFWRLGEPSRHYFRWANDNTQWKSSHEAHFVGSERRRITLGDNRGEAFDLGARLQLAVSIAIVLLLALACIDARALGLLGRFEHSVGTASASYCPEPDVEPPASRDPNLPGCELIRRAYALGYAKSLGQCEVQEKRAVAAASCARRQRDEPVLHYAWRLLAGSWSNLRQHTEPAYFQGLRHDFDERVDHLGALGRAEREMLASSPHASHHIWTNLPDPGDGAFREQTCADRYRWLAHRPTPSGDKRASKVFEHILAQLLFESRYEPAAGACREYHIHWSAPLDTCHHLNPTSDIKLVLDRLAQTQARTQTRTRTEDPSTVISFQCYFEDTTTTTTTTSTSTSTSTSTFTFTTTPLDLLGHHFTVGEIHIPPSSADSTLYIDRYDAIAKLLVPGFHYGALLSEAGLDSPSSPEGLQSAFAGHDYLLTRLHGLDSLDIYLDAGFLAARPDLLEVYPYERHLKNYVQIFRRQYARTRGRL